jgi:hypothetical protein
VITREQHQPLARAWNWLAMIDDEDGDYMCRRVHEGVSIASVPMRGIGNIMAAQDNAGWLNLSGIVNGKAAQVNRKVFREKW